MMNIQEINSHFRIDGRFASATTIGSGHINDSWLVITNGLNVGATGPVAITEYVLQRINKNIFKNIPELTNNILKVTGHLRLKSLNFSPAFQTYQIIRLIPAISGEYFYLDPGGNYWRLYNHVTGSRSYDVVENPQMAYEAGKAFGLFQHLTADMDATTLFEVLPGFHNIAKRLADFRKTVSLDPVSRVAEVAEEINFVESRAGEMHTILRLGEQGKIPVRVTHNDTKCNNVLFNQENQAIAVVDLDTMMPGYMLYDFGDAIRTGANTAAEDEADLSKVSIDLKLFEAYSRGFLSATRYTINESEMAHLAFSALFMTFIIGLRFLTDHLDGDLYYKTAFPGHNLQRARSQFRLMESMEEKLGEMEKIIHGILNQQQNGNNRIIEQYNNEL